MTPTPASDGGGDTLGPVLARLARPTSQTPTRLAVVADPHLSPTASGTWKVFHRTENRLRAAVTTVNDLAVDATVLLGDLTRDGRPAEFDCVDEILSSLQAPWVAVPGNHDVPKLWDDYETPSVDEFAARYARGRFPFHVGVGGLDLFGLDSASGDGDLYESHEGWLPPSQLAWLDDRLETATNPVVALHHNVFHPRRHTGQFPEGEFYQLQNAAALRELLTAHDVELVLSGHIHWPATAAVDGLREIIAPATCSFPQAALLVDVDRHGTTVRYLPLAGPRAMAEAYTLASAGNAHGQGVTAYADRGVLSTFPLVDERPRPSGIGTDVPGAVRWR